MHQDLVVRPDHFGYCIPAMVAEVGDENLDRAVAHGSVVSKSLREHMLPHSSGKSQRCRYHKPIVDFVQMVRHYLECFHVKLHDAPEVAEHRTIYDRSPYQDCMMEYDRHHGMVADS